MEQYFFCEKYKVCDNKIRCCYKPFYNIVGQCKSSKRELILKHPFYFDCPFWADMEV